MTDATRDDMDPELVQRLEADALGSVAVPHDLWDRLDAELATQGWRDRLVSRSTPQRALLGALGAAVAGGLLIGIQGVRADLDGSGWIRFWAVSLPLLAVALSGGLLSVRSRGATVIRYDALAAVLGLAVLLASFTLSFPGMHGVPLVAHLHCLGATALATTGIAVWFALLERDPRPAPARVALGAVGGGAWAHVAQSVFCPGADTVHLLVGHGLSAVGIAALAAMLATAARR